MANSEAVGILQQGVARWNEWRKDKDGPSLDLSEADLRDRDLTGIDLRAVNLSNTVLRGTKIGKGSLLWNANLSGADLYGANLRGADLQDVNFSGADLFQADLRETNLQGSDLSTAKGGLLSKQLAGADLTGAKLPEPLAKLYDGLSSVKEISDSAQKLFLALLAGCLYSWLTIAQTTDVELITNRASTPLPIIQAAIPIAGFYVVTPLILLCMYFYFHFYLQKLWEELGSLPAVFTDGRELHKRTDPWLLNDLVRSHFAKLKDGRPFLSYFQAWVSVVLAWWLVPITLFLFWGRYLRRHDLSWTVFHALLLALAIFSAVRLYRIAGETLRGNERTVFRWTDVVRHRTTYLRLSTATVLSAFLIAISVGAIFGEPETDARSPRSWVPGIMEKMHYSPFANLTNADGSTKPANWTGKKDDFDLVKGATLISENLRYAQAANVFLAKSHLDNSDFDGAILNFADLRGASLKTARFNEALLNNAQLNEADLTDASLVAVRLNESDLSNAILGSANLTEARLNLAILTDANLQSANLSRAHLVGTNLTRARLHLATLTGADFTSANLTSADLSESNLTDAGFSFTRFRYADFREAKGLTRQAILEATNWQLAFYDPDMVKQLGLPPDHNEKLQKQKEAEQQAKAAAAPLTAPALPIRPKAKP